MLIIPWFKLATGENLLPFTLSIWANHTYKQEDEQALKGIKDGEQNLKSLSESWNRNDEDGKEPGESKEEHHSTNTEQ